MKPRLIIIIVLALLVASAIALFLKFYGSAESKSDEAASDEKTAKNQVAEVTTTKVERKTISQITTTYGSVTVDTGKLQTVSVAFESHINHVLVAPGQSVTKGMPLVEIRTSAATQLGLQQTKNSLELAHKELAQTKDRYAMRLATNQELNAAQKTATDAKLQFASLQKAGAEGDGLVRADREGIVATVAVQDGQLVSAGGALVEIVGYDEIEVSLGMEAEDIANLKTGDPVALFAVNQPITKPVSGVIRLLTKRIDATSRLVSVYVSLPADSGLLLGGYIRAELTKSAADALVVPRSAVLPQGEDYTLFTIRNGQAMNHLVKIGFMTDKLCQIISTEVVEGDSVVVTGNPQLKQGMSVKEVK